MAATQTGGYCSHRESASVRRRTLACCQTLANSDQCQTDVGPLGQRHCCKCCANRALVWLAGSKASRKERHPGDLNLTQSIDIATKPVYSHPLRWLFREVSRAYK
jgi:hypothetical protein